MEIVQLNLAAGWVFMLLGALSGALLGLNFHAEKWLGGYNSWRRRLLRLGHIACFGMGILNILFALSVASATGSALEITIASCGLLIGALMMPLCCALAAWKKILRHLFCIPVIGLCAAFLSMTVYHLRLL